MKYEEKTGPDNFKRFETVLKKVLSTSNVLIRERIDEEKRIKRVQNSKRKASSSRASGDKG